MATISFDDLDDNESVTCTWCAWSGPVADCDKVLFNEVMEVNCPECDARVYLVSYAPRRSSRAAAAPPRPGSAAEAVRNALAKVQPRRPAKRHAGAALPEIPGDNLHFVWDYQRIGDVDTSIIRHGSTELWREDAYWECYLRFEIAFDRLRDQYGDRLADLVPTTASHLYLDGDRLGSRRARDERRDDYRRERTARTGGPDHLGSFVAGYLGRDETMFIGDRAADWSDPEAFKDGWALNDAERMVQSADSARELERDERDLQAVLTRVVERYGDGAVEAARTTRREAAVRPLLPPP